MPGIVGIITKQPREAAMRGLNRMVEAMRHESFYSTGSFADEASGVYVGWIARQGSFAEQMPVCSERDERMLVFSGEDYPDPDTAQRLKSRGHVFGTRGPEYLVHQSEEDANFPASVNGRFQGLLLERSSHTATLFNDRYGMARVYYYENKDAFYFAAEAKAILAVRPELRATDPRSLAELASCGCVLENRTVFKDIFVLPPASAWKLRAGTAPLKAVYFQPAEWEQQAALEPGPYYESLREVFTRNLPRYFAGQPVGLSLTGGLDSRIVLAWRRPEPNTLPCYSFGGMFRDCEDVSLARAVAKIAKQPHQTIPVAEEFLSRFGHYCERTAFLSDGCVDPSHSPDLYINEIARDIAPVRMTGNYGGEVMRQVRQFKHVEPPAGLFRQEFLPHIAEARKTFTRLTDCHPLSFSVFRQAPWHHYGLQALEQTQLTLRSPYLDNDFVKTVFRAPLSVLASNDVSIRLIAEGNAALSKVPTDRGLGLNGGSSFAALRHQWKEFTFKAEYAYDYGMPQWVASADHTMAPLHLERLFLGRHKFYHFRYWYRAYLGNYVREILLDPRTLARPYVQPKTLERMVDGHVKGDRNYTTAIHKLLSLELIHRLFVD
jgi:asparagine synthase (glutamine-hydrolysing)